jgi:hypothetical protein
MVRTQTTSVEEYLAELPEEKRAVIVQMRELIRRNLPAGYEEAFQSGMITFQIPLAVFPDTYNGQPFGYVSLAAQKNYYALYLIGPYMEQKQRDRLQKAFDEAGRKMDMGKSCLRFKSPSDLPLDAIADVIASTPPEVLMARARAVRAKRA